jgi:ComF family protein
MQLFLGRLFQFFLPSQCACCGTFLEEGQSGLCTECFALTRLIDPPFCSVCGAPFVSPLGVSHICGGCQVRKKHFTTARAVAYYEGPLQETLHRWKYRGRISLTPFLGRWMAERLRWYWTDPRFELLIPVPLHVKRLRNRGFNQALLLTRELSRWTRIPYEKRVLLKRRVTVPQVDLSGAEREREIRGAFTVPDSGPIEDRSVLLVDDVYTTGATVNECAKVLLAAGARRVDVFTLARAVKHF